MTLIDSTKYTDVPSLLNDLREAALQGTTFLTSDGEILMVTQGAIARSQMAEQIARRLADQPSLLSEIQNYLQSDEEPEDWE